MPSTATIHSLAFDFDELEDSAKETARDWYRGCIDEIDYDCVIDDFTTIAEMIGVTFDTHEVQLYGGSTRQEPDIWWSVSHCQGDGACFEGSYDYKPDATVKIREYCSDEKLIAITDELAEVQKRNLFGLQAVIKKRDHHYTHEHTVSIEVTDKRDEDRCDDELNVAEKEIGVLMQRLMRWLHGQLRDQSDYLYSDEAVDESITANEYQFNEDGTRHAYA